METTVKIIKFNELSADLQKKAQKICTLENRLTANISFRQTLKHKNRFKMFDGNTYTYWNLFNNRQEID